MIELCLVGAGDVVQVRHAAILANLSDRVRVTGVVSTRPDAVAAIESRLGYGVSRYESVERGAESNPQAVLVAVPASQTCAIASFLVRYGLPLYIEKPLAADVIAGAKLVEEIISQGLPAVVGENFSQQARFILAPTLCHDCTGKPLTHLAVRDTLRRGARTVPRTDEHLFMEHSVHFISASRRLTSAEIVCVNSASARAAGSLSEYRASCGLSTGATLDITFTLANVWSEDRYLATLDNADTCITHSFDFSTRQYTDTLSHYHGVDELVKIMTIPNAECGIRRCWEELIDIIESGQKQPSPSLISSLNDIQVREAMLVALRRRVPVPVSAFRA